MAMKKHLGLSNELIQLKKKFKHLGIIFIKAGEDAQKGEVLPDKELLEELESTRGNFDDLVERMSQYAKEIGGQIDFCQVDSLLEIEKLWNNMLREQKVDDNHAEAQRQKVGNLTWRKDENGRGDTSSNKKLQELLFDLLKGKKYGPAFWVANYARQELGVFIVPPLLIKALELSEVVRVEEGPAAQWLSSIYKDPDFYSYLDYREEQGNLVRRLLFLAALLRPSYVAPESGAAYLLNKIPLPDGLDMMQSFFTNREEKEKKAREKRQEKQQAIAQEVQDWFARNKELHMASDIASNLWKKMQEQGSLLDNLLTPIAENDLDGLDHIRNVIYYLKNEENIKQEIAQLTEELFPSKSSSEFFFVPGSWQILERVREAIKMAERWVRTCETGSTREEVERMTEKEVGNLVRIAREELNTFCCSYEEDKFLQTAIYLCQNALDILEQTALDKQQKDIQGEDPVQMEITLSPQLKLRPLLKPEEDKIRRMGKAIINIIEQQDLTGQAFTKIKDDIETNKNESINKEQTFADELQSYNLGNTPSRKGQLR